MAHSGGIGGIGFGCGRGVASADVVGAGGAVLGATATGGCAGAVFWGGAAVVVSGGGTAPVAGEEGAGSVLDGGAVWQAAIAANNPLSPKPNPMRFTNVLINCCFITCVLGLAMGVYTLENPATNPEKRISEL